jgi:hypothetical protein
MINGAVIFIKCFLGHPHVEATRAEYKDNVKRVEGVNKSERVNVISDENKVVFQFFQVS